MWRQRRDLTLQALGVGMRQPVRRGAVNVTDETALRHSAVWACLRVRADLLSTFPIDVFRKVNGVDVEMPVSPILVEPGGSHWDYNTWMWASQFDYDRAGNTVGLITEKNALGLPARIDLVEISRVQVFQNKNMAEHRYRIDGKVYTPDQVWHERQFPVPGLPVGLSPIAYAAWSIGEGLSMQQFVLDWFGGGGMPKARLHNLDRSLENDGEKNEARRIKDRYMASVANGEIFVHGKDWSLDFLQAQTMGNEWLDGRRSNMGDIARYFGCPLDLIEAAISAPGSITYQSALQRNLQFLIINLNPAIVRRENGLSKLLPRPRYVKMATAALLRMDPMEQAKLFTERIQHRSITPSEIRKFYNQQPFTPEQEAELVRIFGAPRTPATASGSRAQDGWPWEPVNPLSAVPYHDLSEVGQ